MMVMQHFCNSSCVNVSGVQDHGAPVSAQDALGNTPLHEASTGAKIDIVKQIVARGADLSIANNAGETCLHIAARLKTSQTASFLAKEGASVCSSSSPSFLLHFTR
jgi:ankyrin repeat protein